MNVCAKCLTLAFGFVLSFAVGSVVADGAENAREKISLFEAFQRMVPLSRGAMWSDAGEEKKTVSPKADWTARAEEAARTFGRKAVPIQGVQVLLPMPEATGNAANQLAAARQWLDGFGGIQALDAFREGNVRTASQLATSLQSGEHRFGDLTPQQQQQALALFRSIEVYRVSGCVEAALQSAGEKRR